jgi:SAM-dependent methyltransferase
MGDLGQLFEDEFAKPPSDIEQQAALAALGEEYPAGLETYSWVSRTELRRAADVVGQVGGPIADVGCGRGGPGLWVAGAVRAPLVGIDIAESALARARSLADKLDVPAEFRVGTFEETGLPDSSVGALLSFDAFLFTPDKAAGLVELARVLRPGGRLVMTSWDYHSQPVNRPPQVADHRPLVEAAGLHVVSYEDSEDWHTRCVLFVDFLLEHAGDLARDAGAPVDDVRAGISEMRATIDCMTRRFILIAQRPNSPESRLH